MRKNLHFAIVTLFAFFITAAVSAQTGSNQASGYFFHPSSPRAISLVKTIQEVSPSIYEADLADLGSNGYRFRFQIDSSNHLIGWTPVGATPASSGFMTLDNPGNIDFSAAAPNAPGSATYNQTKYNNTYDPATHTLYMHYGYVVGGALPANQSQFTRQVYEQWVTSNVQVTSYSPTNITEGTVVTVKGSHLTGVSAATFTGGGFAAPAQSFNFTGDSIINVVVGKGLTGNLNLTTATGDITLQGFNFTAPNLPITPWAPAGPRPLTPSLGTNITMASAPTGNKPFVMYVDENNGRKLVVQKLVSNTWVKVGAAASDGPAYYASMAIGKDGLPWVTYEDSATGNLTVKKYDGTKWALVGARGFTKAPHSFTGINIALDSSDIPYITGLVTDSSSTQGFVYCFKNSKWQKLGGTNIGFSPAGAEFSMAVDKTTNTVYVFGGDVAHNTAGIVKKFDGVKWVTAGQPYFTTGTLGVYYPSIAIGVNGSVFAGGQDDNGPEQGNVYKLVNGTWTAVGNANFSPMHIYRTSLAIDKLNAPHILFLDSRNYQQSTVMRLKTGTNTWQTVGALGVIPTSRFLGVSGHAMTITAENKVYVGFNDHSNGDKVSVFVYNAGDLPNAPSITSFVPAMGFAGTEVTIKGKHFTGASTVTFGDSATSSFTVLSDSVIKAIVGNGATGAVSVTTNISTGVKTGFAFCKPINPSVTVTASTSTTICSKTPVTFTARAVNAGDSIIYIWKKAGKKVGTNSATYTDTLLKTNDSVYVIVTAYSPCGSLSDTSNVLKFTVNPIINSFVTIKASTGSSICAGTLVTFTATIAANEDSVNFVWKKNGNKVGTNSATYSDKTLKNNDSVWVIFKSYTPCSTSPSINSNRIKFIVTPIVKPAVTIEANKPTTICAGTSVKFTATAVNGGTTVGYLWQINGKPAGTTRVIYSDTLHNGDKVTCTIHGNARCSMPDTAVSNALVFTVFQGAPVAPASISGKTTVTAGQAGVVYSVAGVSGASYIWTVPVTDTITAGQGTRSITVNWGSVSGAVTVQLSNVCGKSAIVSKAVTVTPGFVGEENTNTTLNALLYPNPATDVTNLQVSGYHGKVIITISDAMGRVVTGKVVSLLSAKMIDRQQYQLSVGNLAAGLYIVTVKDDTGVKSFRLVKSK